MRTQVQQASYQEALTLVTNLGRVASDGCFSIALLGFDGVWRLELLGYDSPALNRLRTRLRLAATAVTAHPETNTVHELFEGYSGRTAVQLVKVTHTIEHFAPPPQEKILL